jgi:hypothetical protein
MATVCVICEKEKAGTPVYEDIIIRSIRRVKQGIKGIIRRVAPSLLPSAPSILVPQNNKLVVCKGCAQEHAKRRANFEKWLIIYVGLGGLMAVVFLILSQSLMAVFAGVVILMFMAALALLSYWPSLEDAAPKARAGKRKK